MAETSLCACPSWFSRRVTCSFRRATSCLSESESWGGGEVAFCGVAQQTTPNIRAKRTAFLSMEDGLRRMYSPILRMQRQSANPPLAGESTTGLRSTPHIFFASWDEDREGFPQDLSDAIRVTLR